MICADIMNVEELQKLKLVAGEKGLYRHIRWLYFADSMRVVDDDEFDDPEKYGHWIQGGELMVITNEAIINNDDFIEKLVFNSKEKCASGVIVQKEKCTDFLIDLANQNEIPLFELPWDIRLIDLSQIVTTMIINEKTMHTSLESILTSILYGHYESEEDVMKLASSYRFDLSEECTLVKIVLKDAKNPYTSMDYLTNLTRNVFDNIGLRHIIILPETNGILVLFPSEKLENEKIYNCFKQISTSFFNKEKMQIRIGISLRKKQISEYKIALKEAVLSEKIAETKIDFIQFYNDLGMIKVFSSVQDKGQLLSFYNEILGKLETSDNVSDGNLCETLKVYIDCNCNALDASKKLFVHRNTMRYRLNKIEEILNISLNDIHQTCLIKNAFEIKRYLDLVE